MPPRVASSDAEHASGAEIPILVFTDSEVVDAELRPISPSMIRFQHLEPHDLSLRRLIVQNAPSGNTMLVNRALIDLALPIPAEAVMHDHWLTLVAAAMGKIGFLDRATVHYRQHSGNVYGASSYSLSFFLRKLGQGRERLRERFMQNVTQAVAFGDRYAGRLDARDREMLDALRSFPSCGFWGRRKLLWKCRLRKSGFLRNLGMYLAV